MTVPNTDLKCSVCRKPKAKLKPRKSRLNPAMPMFLCLECFEGRKEPRFLVILVARQPGGLEKVRDYIRNHRYYGNKITAEELV